MVHVYHVSVTTLQYMLITLCFSTQMKTSSSSERTQKRVTWSEIMISIKPLSLLVLRVELITYWVHSKYARTKAPNSPALHCTCSLLNLKFSEPNHFFSVWSCFISWVCRNLFTDKYKHWRFRNLMLQTK